MRRQWIRRCLAAVLAVAFAASPGLAEAVSPAPHECGGVGLGSRRIAGDDRYGTALAAMGDYRQVIRDRGSDGQIERVAVVRGDAFPDALAATTIAGAGHLLALARRDGLGPEVMDLLADADLAAGYILGDEEVVPVRVEDQIDQLGALFDGRAGGADRYETARLAAEYRIASGDQYSPPVFPVVIASGETFADGLLAPTLVRWIAETSVPPLLLLTPSDRLAADTAAVLSRVSTSGEAPVVVLGGPGAISDQVIDQIIALGVPEHAISRLFGADRYRTATRIADIVVDQRTDCAPAMPSVVLARGDDFADALAAGLWSLAGGGQPILLVEGRDLLGAAARDWLEEHSTHLEEVIVFGGEGAISDAVWSDAKAIATASR